MNTEIKESESDDATLGLNDQEQEHEESIETEGAESDESDGTLRSPEFQEFSDDQVSPGQPTELSRFQNIKVSVSAELGRAEVPIQTLMDLGEGSVLELNREIDSPVELVAQGVALACGEVVVVNGCFAIRVTKVYETK